MLQDSSFDTSIDPVLRAQVPMFDIHQLITDHHLELLSWLRLRLPIQEDAKDIAQETYLRILKYEHVEGIQHPLALLYRIAQNLAIDAERRNATRHSKYHVEDYEGLDVPCDMPDFGQALDAERTLRRVQDAINSLSPRCREVFVMNRFGNMSYSEVADHFGISVKMVEKHISNALMVCHRYRRDQQTA
ncbi:MAG: RNA polymerase sigma factor [Pseudomonadota bacterium]